MFMVSAFGLSHPGHVRKINEDAWLADPALGLFIVADGMGGHNAGEIASKMAVESIHSFMRRTTQGTDVTWPYGIEARLSFDANRLRTAMKLANRRVFKAAEGREDYSGMGTTVVALQLSEGLITYGNVGDSRLYLWSEGRLVQLTRDDTWAALVGVAPSASFASEHPLRHVLTNVIGAQDKVDFEIQERPLASFDRLLMCTDGLHTELTDEVIAEIMRARRDPQSTAEALIERALTSKAGDNLTVLVVGGPAASPPEART
jgi:protein phosphatase